MSNLSVDRSKPRHYRDEKGRYWSVSQVCEIVSGGCDYYGPGSDYRGQDLHDIFALEVSASVGQSDRPEVPVEYAGYHQAIMAWIAHAKPQPMMLERTVRHKVYPYAGRVDFVGMLGPDYGVLDLKTGVPAPWHRVQVHGYQKMLDKAARMWILYIKDNGEFKQVSVKPSARDWAVFTNGLSILQWREVA